MLVIADLGAFRMESLLPALDRRNSLLSIFSLSTQILLVDMPMKRNIAKMFRSALTWVRLSLSFVTASRRPPETALSSIHGSAA